MSTSIALFGLGRLGCEHYKAMRLLSWLPSVCLGRSHAGCDKFANEFGPACLPGGLAAISQLDAMQAAVVAISHEELAKCAQQLIDKGCKYILLEKPGALGTKEMTLLSAAAERAGAQVFIAYNRRFYDSVRRLEAEIEADGGLVSMHFEFNEIEHSVLSDNLPPDVLRLWGIVNSTHVIDLAFHLAGRPAQWHHHRNGSLPWHPSGAVFVGSGDTDRGVMFSYTGNWVSPGRWGLEFATRHRRFFLRPLEELKVQVKGSMQVENVVLSKQPTETKEGIVGQMQAFKTAVETGTIDPSLCTMKDALTNMKLYETMFGYGPRVG